MREERVHEALDLCLARMRRGESLERCLFDFEDLAEELRPLLLVLRDVLSVREASIPVPPGRLAAGRRRFLVAARGMDAAAPVATVAEALDDCLVRLHRGDTIEAALAEYPVAIAQAVRPLVEMAQGVTRAVVAPPAPPSALRAGRERFLAAGGPGAAVGGIAAAYRNGHAGAGAEPNPVGADAMDGIGDALDTCLARLRAGERIDIVLADYPAPLADALRPLIAVAGEIFDSLTPAPAPARGLAPGRARFLEVAARARAHHAAVDGARRQAAATVAERAGWRGRIWPRVGALALRASAALALAVAAFLGGAVAVEHSAAVASALPGDSAYFIKRLNEQIDLLTTFDSGARARLESDLDRRRADEVAALSALGREADVTLRAAFLGLEEVIGPDGGVQLLLRVRIPPSGEGATEQVIQWAPGAAVDLGAFGDLRDLPPGTVLDLTVRTGGGASGRAQAVEVRVAQGAVLQATGTPTQAASATVVLRSTDAPKSTRTPVGDPSDQPPPPTPTQPPPTATIAATPTLALVPTAQGILNDPGKSPRKNLRGIVVAQPDPDVWRIEVGCPGKVVRVDIGQIGDMIGVDVLRRSVEVRGRFTDEGETEFVATKLQGNDPEPIRDEIGTVKELPGDGRLVLESNGETYTFQIGSAAVGGNLAVGVKATVQYRGCKYGSPEAVTITVLAPPPVRAFAETGVVADLSEASFTLVVDEEERFVVHFDADTVVRGPGGAPIALANGQRVEVHGTIGDDDTVHADEIIVEESAPPVPPELHAPTIMPEPTATRLPELAMP